MSALRGCLVVHVLLAAAAAQAAGAPAATFRFAWPVPGSVAVAKSGEKKGEKARMRFRIELAAGAGDELRARQVGFELLELGGRDATTPAAKAALAPAMALTQAVPDIVVDAQGRYLRVDGLDAMFERVVAFLGEAKGMPEPQRDRLLQTLRAPATQATLQQACGDDWNTWVGAWVAFDAAPDRETTAAVGLPFLGETLPAALTRRHHGPADGHAGHVRLSATTLAEGEAVAAAFTAAMTRMAQQAGKPFPADRVESVRTATVLEVVTDPATLMPLRASRTQTVRIAMKGEAPREQVERSEFEFDWTKAAPAGR